MIMASAGIYLRLLDAKACRLCEFSINHLCQSAILQKHIIFLCIKRLRVTMWLFLANFSEIGSWFWGQLTISIHTLLLPLFVFNDSQLMG